MSTYKLTYYNITGPAEPIRYLLSYGKENFEDDRSLVDHNEHDQYSFLNKKLKFQIDDKIYYHSVACARYLAKKFDLAGNNHRESLEIDNIVENIIEIRETCSVYNYATTPRRVELNPTVYKKLTLFMDFFEKVVLHSDGYLALGRLTWADIFLAATTSFLSHCVDNDVLEYKPNLNALVMKVKALPSIKKYISESEKPKF